MIYVLTIIFLIVFNSSDSKAVIPVYGEITDDVSFKRVLDVEICRYQRVVVHGAKNYLRVRGLCGKEQLKIVAGILYIGEFYSPNHIYVSPLPSPQSLKKYGKSFHIIHSRVLSFYVNDLKKELQITHRLVSSVLELDKTLPETLQEAEVLIILPDPVYYDAKGQAILRYWLRRHPKVKVLDLANINIEHPNLIRLRLERERYIQTIREVFNREDLRRGGIYYVDY